MDLLLLLGYVVDWFLSLLQLNQSMICAISLHIKGYCSHFQDESSFFSNSWLCFYFYKNCSCAQRDGEAESFQETLTHDSKQLLQLITAWLLTLTPAFDSQNIHVNSVRAHFCSVQKTSNLYYMIYHIRTMIYVKQFPKCNEIGFEINIYIFIFDFDMWFSICIFCILHLYEKVFGVACSSFLKATPTVRNLLISGSFNSDSP